MASTDKTDLLKLPQWQDNDKLEMADLNDAFEKVDTGLTTRLAEDANKHIHSSGSNTNGEFIKFDDGTMICTKTYSGTVGFTSAQGSLFVTGAIVLGSFAQPFVSRPKIKRELITSAPYGWLSTLLTHTETDAGRCVVLKPTSATGVAVSIDIIAVGRWE